MSNENAFFEILSEPFLNGIKERLALIVGEFFSGSTSDRQQKDVSLIDGTLVFEVN